MTTLQTAQLVAETLSAPVPVARSAQLVVEVLSDNSVASKLRTAQVVVEVLRNGVPAVINDRDVLLLASLPRFGTATNAGASVSLTVVPSVPAFTLEGTTATPSAIVLSALLIGVAGTVAWTTNDGSILSITGNTATLTHAAMVSNACVVTATFTPFGGNALSSSCTISRVTSATGQLQAPGSGNYVNLTATGTTTFLKIGTTVDVKADGSGSLARALLVGAPALAASGTASVSSGTLAATAAWTTWIDTGVDAPAGYATAATNHYGATAEIGAGTSAGGGVVGYLGAQVSLGNGVGAGGATSNRLYIRVSWEGPGSGAGTITITSISWKLVRL